MLEVLSEHGIEFVVIGGVGVSLQGSALVTQDLDIFPRSSADNFERLAAALAEVDAYPFHQPDTWVALTAAEMANRRVAEWGTVFGKLDVLLAPSGAGDYDDVAARADRMTVGNHEISVADVDALISMKRATGRGKDERALMDLVEIRRLRDRQGP